MDPRALLRLEAELEYGVPLQGDIIPVTPENTRDVPLVTIARFADGYELLFREGISDAARAHFTEQDASALLAASPNEFAGRVIDCRWYVISRIPDRTAFPDVIGRDGGFVIERDGQIAAEAWSSQNGERAAALMALDAALDVFGDHGLRSLSVLANDAVERLMAKGARLEG